MKKALITGITGQRRGKIRLEVPDKTCPECGKIFGRDSCRQLSDFKEKTFCSRECYHNFAKGPNHPNYKDGTKTRKDGYIRNSQDEYIHRIIVENSIGRALTSNEQVHHIDGDTSNNDITNLQLFSSNSEHRRYEVQLQKRGVDGKFVR